MTFFKNVDLKVLIRIAFYKELIRYTTLEIYFQDTNLER
jgi:hypothetical protein